MLSSEAASRHTPWSPLSGPPADHCLWCGAPLGTDGLRLTGRVGCSRCGTATTSPVPTDPQLAEAYGDWYRPSRGRFGPVGDALLRRTRSTLARRIDRIAPPGRVLDVGAGDGTLVEALLRLGREAVGLERHGHGEHVVAGDVWTMSGQWSAIVLWHSLEHLRDPVATLRRAVELLAPGGLLVLALPNADSLQAKAFGDRWLALDLPRHLSHIPAPTLLSTLAELGLTVSRVGQLRGGQVAFGWAHGLVGRLPGHLDLYDAIRSPEARATPMTSGQRARCLAAAALVTPVALAAAVLEVLTRRGGSVYVEARA